jgi:hypothetical protein
VFDLAWGLSLHSGRVVAAESRHRARCPCCRRELALTTSRYRHPRGRCVPAQVEHALAWRIGMALFSSRRPPTLQEHCVACGDPTDSPLALSDGGPAGGQALWTTGSLTLHIGPPTAARVDEVRVRAREILTAEGTGWDAVARRRCAPCTDAQDALDAAGADAARDSAQHEAAAVDDQARGRAQDRAAARWGLTGAWGPYTIDPCDCAACGARVIAYRWSAALPPAPRPRVVSPDGQQRCVACGELLR